MCSHVYMCIFTVAKSDGKMLCNIYILYMENKMMLK